MSKLKPTNDKRQNFLFEYRRENETPEVRWELPNLTGEKRISLDTEGTGLRIWGKDVPIGLSVSTEDFKNAWYIPWGHNVGFNFDLDNVILWSRDNLRDKDIDLNNAKFDFNMLLKVGIDLEQNGNRLHDIMHCPALLYSNRGDYSLDTQAKDELGKNKVKLEGDFDSFPMQERNSAGVDFYARYDALLTAELAAHYRPKIEREGLQRVLQLEDSLIYAVASMERNGALLDRERLHEWRRAAHSRYIKAVLDLYKMVGARIEPTKPSDMAKLFTILKLDYELTPTGQPSFTNEFLTELLGSSFNVETTDFQRKAIQIAYDARQLASIESKFLSKYDNAVDENGIIRYALNQLKATNTEGNVGAVTGRFSSSGGGKHVNGINIQQVFDDEKQEKIESIRDFPIRDLFVPEKGKMWLSADAMQIEFRLFAHYANSPRLTQAYIDDPLINFHKYVAKNILKVEYSKLVKNMNFGKLYEIGINKLANIYLKCSYEEAKEKSDHYDREFPEAKWLSRAAMKLAEERGYVKTILGRRRRYIKGVDERYYSALNAVIQGTAADIMKLKILELYNSREETQFNMRFTVHDEVDGDVPDKEHALKVKEILNRPALDGLRIPILWSTAIGPTWKQIEEI